MNAVVRRIRNLEDHFGASAKPPRIMMRFICTTVGDLNLANCTCTRTLMANGELLESVHLDGSVEGLCRETLDAFVARFPIERQARRFAG